MLKQHEVDVDGKTYKVDVETNSDGWVSAKCDDVPGAIIGFQTVLGNEGECSRVPDSIITAIRNRVSDQ